MAFLTKEELTTVATAEIIDLITNTTPDIVDSIIAEDIDQMKSYLFRYYDADAIFNATGADRSLVTLKHLKAVVIRDIYKRRSRTMNAVAQMDYEEAMKWLEDIAKGNIAPDLPQRQYDSDGDGEPDGPTPFMKLGSRKNKANHW